MTESGDLRSLAPTWHDRDRLQDRDDGTTRSAEAGGISLKWDILLPKRDRRKPTHDGLVRDECQTATIFDGTKAAESIEVVEFKWVTLLAQRHNSPYSASVREENREGPRNPDRLETRSVWNRARALSILREYRGVSQKDLAEAAGVNKTTISAYERGQLRIGPHKLDQVLDALELPMRAWEATLRHLDWLDWLTQRREHSSEPLGRGASIQSTDSGHTGLDPLAVRSQVDRIAEAAAREREQFLTAVLELFVELIGSPRGAE